MHTKSIRRSFCKQPVKWLLAGCCLISAPAYAAPQIQQWQTSSGAKVLFVEDHNIPMLDIAVTVAAGSSYDAPAKSGTAALTSHMMELGAGELDEDKIATHIADLGAILSGSFDQDKASKTLRTLSKPDVRDRALQVMATVLQQPTFPPAILEREKSRIISMLKEAETQPKYIADKAFQKAVFGDHPYALSSSGEIASINQITIEDLKQFYNTFYLADNAVVAIMGDATRQDAEAIAEKLTHGLPKSSTIPAPTKAPSATAPSEQRISHPASQSHILIGSVGMSRTDPDYFPLFVGNYILGGGGFVSRLMNEVREKRGMAYSVYSYFRPLTQPGLFQIGLQTQKAQADEALKVVRHTLQDFIDNGPSEQELKAAKQNLVGGFPLRIDSNSKILRYLSVIGFYDLPLSYLNDFTHKVEAVTVAQIRDAFQQRIKPDAMATVIVGAPDKQESEAEN